jgi:hypothetical protein
MIQYLLPCSCGRQTAVEPRQAGETVVCPCGASLSVPTLLDMRNLEPAPPAAKASQTSWELKHQLRLMGILLLAIGLGGGIWLYLNKPMSVFDTVDPERIRQNYQKLTPSMTWEGWTYMQRGLDQRTDEAYAAALVRFHAWLGVFGVVALAGFVSLIAGTLGTKGGRSGQWPVASGQ